jgi:cyclophilin family peptidyl-prolyl cis-trans isomerase
MLPPMSGTTVVFETDLGDLEIALDQERAPKTVAKFLRYVDEGHYAGTIFHRVIPGFMAQGGGYDAKYEKKSVHEPVENEADKTRKNTRGTVAMARTNDPHSATAQFFVNVTDNAFLDHTAKSGSGWGYTVFGEVTSGLEVADKMVATPTGAKGPFAKDAPLEPIVIKSARRKA